MASPMLRVVPSIAIILNDASRFARMNYFVDVLADAWREMGIDSALADVTGPRPTADAAFMHVNATRVPQDCLDMAAGFTAVVNAHATDISKRLVSRRLVEREDGYKGAVIIKTDGNCGGLPKRFGRYDTPVVGTARSVWDRFGPWQLTNVFRYGTYPVLRLHR